MWRRWTDRVKQLAGMDVPLVSRNLDDTDHADDEGRRIGFPRSQSIPKRPT